MRSQRGLTLISLLIVSAVIILFAIIGMKVMPAYIEYFTIKRTLQQLARSPDLRGGNTRDVQGAFDKYAQIDDIKSVAGRDLAVEKHGDGFTASVAYSTRVQLFGNISACIEFEASSGR